MAKPLNPDLFPPSAILTAVVEAGGPLAMSRKLGVAQNTVRGWLALGGVPDTRMAVKLSRMLGVLVEVLAPPDREDAGEWPVPKP